MKINDLYQRVTNRIIDELENGVVPWLKPWSVQQSEHAGSSEIMPRNATTGRFYSGINVLILWDAAVTKGYSEPMWCTFKQAKAKGWQVRKGERGEQICFMGSAKKTVEDQNGDERTRTVRFMKVFTVFNVAQLDGYEAGPMPANDEPSLERDDVGQWVERIGANVQHGGGRACYIPSLDIVRMPVAESFGDEAAYWSTLVHEHVHWTSHPQRCDRQLGKRFGDDAYAAEELIAELGAAFACAEQRIEGRLQHASYIDSWLRVLKGDNTAIVTAAAKAAAAVAYLNEAAQGSIETSVAA